MLIHEGDNVGVSLCLTIFAYIYPHITVCCRFRSIDVVLVKMTGMDRFKFGGVYIFCLNTCSVHLLLQVVVSQICHNSCRGRLLQCTYNAEYLIGVRKKKLECNAVLSVNVKEI